MIPAVATGDPCEMLHPASRRRGRRASTSMPSRSLLNETLAAARARRGGRGQGSRIRSQDAGRHLVEAGGKRVRPMACLLMVGSLRR